MSAATPDPQRWGRMDIAIAQRSDLSATAKVVFAVLRCYENTETNLCYPTQQMIATDSGTSINSVKRAIRALIHARIIEVQRMTGESRYLYRLISTTGQNDTSQTGQNGTPNRPKWDLEQAKMIPRTGQNETSVHNKDDKNKKEHKKNIKRVEDIKSSDEAISLTTEWVTATNKKMTPDREKVWARTFDNMQRIDKLSWDDIAAISNYALTDWLPPGYMLSPTKLRTRSRTYPELWNWEVIQGQMQNGSNKRSAESTYDPLQGIELS
tara:strand:- start:308 stop:1108 length:801 start_codon:yes stop_codon:yes gene_type:complete